MGTLLERLYPFVPPTVQNIGVSLYGLLWRHKRLGGRFQQHVADFRERDRWSPERMQMYVEAELRRVLCHAFDNVPHYQHAWEKSGLRREHLTRMTIDRLSDLPITRKQEVRRQPLAFVARNVLRREKLQQYFSSGSTGTPISAFCGAEDHRRFIAAREVRSFGWAGTTLRASRAMIGGRLVVPKAESRPPFHRYNWAERQIYFSAYHISPESLADYVDALNYHQPVVLTGYAQSYFLLARLMCERDLNIDFEPCAAVLCSEKLTRAMKTTIKRALRTRAYEEYGAVENCVQATECECGQLHVNTDFGIMEIVDENGNPVPPGETGRVVCTGLLNEAQPLIRYEIGDLAAWSSDPCPCGRNHLPVLKEIVGRLEDVIVGPDGRQLVRFHWVFIDLPGVLEGQVVQEAIDEFTVNVVTRDGSLKEIRNVIEKRFKERLGPVSIRVQRLAEIPRTERGKFRSVISKVPPPERLRATQNESLFV